MSHAEASSELVALSCFSSQCRKLWDDKQQRSFPLHVFFPSLTISHSFTYPCGLYICFMNCTSRMTPSHTHPAASAGPCMGAGSWSSCSLEALHVPVTWDIYSQAHPWCPYTTQLLTCLL